jgi:hypothetical protein
MLGQILRAGMHSINTVLLGKAIDQTRFVLTNALGEESGHADVEDAGAATP